MFLKQNLNDSQGNLLTVVNSIQRAVTNKMQSIQNNAAKDRIRTPLDLDQAQYSACFGYITVVALHKAHANFTQKARPFEPCTGVFRATTGLPCAHRIDDIRGLGVSLLPSDFHLHSHWDRYITPSVPTLEPIRTVTSFEAQRQTTSTKRSLQRLRLLNLKSDDVANVGSLAIPGIVSGVCIIFDV